MLASILVGEGPFWTREFAQELCQVNHALIQKLRPAQHLKYFDDAPVLFYKLQEVKEALASIEKV